MKEVIREFKVKKDGFLVHAEEWDDGLVTWTISKLHPVEADKIFKPETCIKFFSIVGFSGKYFGIESIKSGNSKSVASANKDVENIIEDHLVLG